MNITPERTDAFLQKKGWQPVADDQAWSSCLNKIKERIGSQFHFRAKTITQQEDSLRRFCSRFPEQVPTPFRFLDWIEFGAYLSEEKKEIEALKELVESHGIIFELVDQTFYDGEKDVEGFAVKLRGFKQTMFQPDGDDNSE